MKRKRERNKTHIILVHSEQRNIEPAQELSDANLDCGQRLVPGGNTALGKFRFTKVQSTCQTFAHGGGKVENNGTGTSLNKIIERKSMHMGQRKGKGKIEKKLKNNIKLIPEQKIELMIHPSKVKQRKANTQCKSLDLQTPVLRRKSPQFLEKNFETS